MRLVPIRRSNTRRGTPVPLFPIHPIDRPKPMPTMRRAALPSRFDPWHGHTSVKILTSVNGRYKESGHYRTYQVTDDELYGLAGSHSIHFQPSPTASSCE